MESIRLKDLQSNIEVYFKLRKKRARSGFMIAARKGRGSYNRRSKFNKTIE